ncbi:tol-pal system protein YbgF [Chitinolyticbacter meiyuanensis]|uniref:tol-pal system protein YbgF n=1 Tax=Chitinolyticbacter meiyuanensis TaxID=682798 RepID=UPI0011E6012B|nr:tol-pal system protein YbgF [Chitinolyticbacter meiyuanensis]
MTLPHSRLLTIVAALALTAPAHAFLSDTQAREDIAALQTQVKQQQDKLTQLEAASRRIVDLTNQIESLKQEIANLRGQIEVLQYNAQATEKRQKDLYVDLDNRVRAIEEAKVQQAQAQAQAQQAAAGQSLDTAIALSRNGKHKEAVPALKRFLAENPGNDKAPEAMYWLGTSQTALKDYKGAAASYSEVVNAAPNDPVAPDALFGLAVVSNAKGDKKGARSYLLQLIEKYPNSDKAEAAKKALIAVD